MLDRAREVAFTFPDAKLATRACGIEDGSLQIVWDFERGSDAVDYRYHRNISCADCGIVVFRSLFDINRHQCPIHVDMMKKE